MYCSDKDFFLTLVRHGQTVGNLSKNVQGHSNTPLTELGLEQARALSRYFQTHGPNDFDHVYSSDLDRAYETCKIIIGGLECCSQAEAVGKLVAPPPASITAIKKDVRLRERRYGPLFEGKPIAHLQSEAYKLGYDQTDFTQYTPEGGESMEDVKQRVTNFCEKTLLPDCRQGDEVLIVSHWATIKEFLKLFQPNANGSIRREHLLETPNAAFCRFQVQCKLIGASKQQQQQQQQSNGVGGLTTSQPSDKLELNNVQALCLHQTPHLSGTQVSVNMKQRVE